MPSQVFYRKWRPQSLAGFIGQEHVTKTLLNALAGEKVSHAYLFCGPRGTGKTTTARNLAKAINCLTNGKGEPCNKCPMCLAITEGRAFDVIEVDAASNRGIDEIRDLRQKVNYAPNEARRKVYIIDEVHMLSKDASNALLKTLEEPPPHVVFILCTTEPHKLLPTVLSRCQRFDFHRYSLTNMVTVLLHVCEGEGINVEEEGLKLIARAATGSLRDALNLLQQANTYYGSEIGLAQVQALLGISGDQRAKEVVKHIINRDASAGITTINNVNNDGLDLRQFHRELVEYLRLLLIVKTGSSESIELTAEDIKELKELAAKASLPVIIKAVKRFGQLELSLDNYSTLPLELALVDCTIVEPEEKTTSVRQYEPEPPVRQTMNKYTPPSTRPRTTAPPASKGSHEPPTDKPAAADKPVPAPVEKSTPSTMAKAESSVAAVVSTIEQLQQQWNKLLNTLHDSLRTTPAAALLRSARPKEIKGDILVVEVRFPFHKEKMDMLDNQKTADKIVSTLLGRACKVNCIYEHENNHLVKAALEMGAQVINHTEERK
jgi:DNA polymerase-3 subunit gamma/tau